MFCLQEDPDLREMLFPDFRADFKLGETYRPVSTAKLPCSVFASGGLSDPRFTKPQMEAWKYWVEGTPHLCEVHFFPGGHHYWLSGEESDKRFEGYLTKRLERVLSDIKKDGLYNTTQAGLIASTSSGDRSSVELPVSTLPMENDKNQGAGPGPGSVRSMASDAGATVASGSSYAAWGPGKGTAMGGDSSMMRSGWSADEEYNDQEMGGRVKRKSWLGNCLCW